jgi:alkylation response protein AidB-like acyl-CoA dehydrogenase
MSADPRSDFLGDSPSLDYPLSDHHLAVRRHAREFAEEKVAPIAEAVDTSDEYSFELHRLLVESGLLTHFVPVEHGGSGLSVTSVSLVREQLSRVCPSADELFSSQGLAVNALVLWGSDAQLEHYLGGLVDGSRIFAFCLSEPGAGSDVAGIEATAVREGDDYVINGTKRFIFAPEAATNLIVFAKTDPALGKRGVSAFIVEQPTEGITCSEFHLLKPAPHSEVTFKDVRVPAANMIGEEGRGLRVALGNLDRLRTSVGAAAVGMASRALEEVVDYTMQREAFGAPLSEMQTIRHRLAAAAAELDAARVLVYAAAANADGAELDVGATSAKAKLVGTETAFRVIDTAVQLHGGIGLRRGSVVERMMRAVRATRIYEGSSEVMQLVIARSLFAGGEEPRR